MSLEALQQVEQCVWRIEHSSNLWKWIRRARYWVHVLEDSSLDDLEISASELGRALHAIYQLPPSLETHIRDILKKCGVAKHCSQFTCTSLCYTVNADTASYLADWAIAGLQEHVVYSRLNRGSIYRFEPLWLFYCNLHGQAADIVKCLDWICTYPNCTSLILSAGTWIVGTKEWSLFMHFTRTLDVSMPKRFPRQYWFHAVVNYAPELYELLEPQEIGVLCLCESSSEQALQWLCVRPWIGELVKITRDTRYSPEHSYKIEMPSRTWHLQASSVGRLSASYPGWRRNGWLALVICCGLGADGQSHLRLRAGAPDAIVRFVTIVTQLPREVQELVCCGTRYINGLPIGCREYRLSLLGEPSKEMFQWALRGSS